MTRELAISTQGLGRLWLWGGFEVRRGRRRRYRFTVAPRNIRIAWRAIPTF
jgi:hypothetical protein